MHELLAFLYKHSRWFLLFLYVIASSVLLFKSNPYQHHLFLTSANAASAGVYKVSNGIYSYFNLHQINEDLNQRNADLQAEVISLQDQLQKMREEVMADTLTLPDSLRQYKFMVARVISNSISKPFNYITLDKGSADGVLPEMGVIDRNGVVGIVNVVGEHSSRVISLLNSNLHLSCRVRGSNSFGSLVWEGSNPYVAYLQELPKHTQFQPGDTVETSGYSGVFPAGIPVGIVMQDNGRTNENFFTLKVLLSTDFTTLGDVQIVMDKMRQEHRKLEESDFTTDRTSGI